MPDHLLHDAVPFSPPGRGSGVQSLEQSAARNTIRAGKGSQGGLSVVLDRRTAGQRVLWEMRLTSGPNATPGKPVRFAASYRRISIADRVLAKRKLLSGRYRKVRLTFSDAIPGGQMEHLPEVPLRGLRAHRGLLIYDRHRSFPRSRSSPTALL